MSLNFFTSATIDTGSGYYVLHRNCQNTGTVPPEWVSSGLMGMPFGYRFYVEIKPGSFMEWLKLLLRIDEPKQTVGEVVFGSEKVVMAYRRVKKLTKVIDYHYAIIPECTFDFKLNVDPEDFSNKYLYEFKFERAES